MRGSPLLPAGCGWDPGAGRGDGIVSLGVFAEAAQDPWYQITQPESLSAPAGGSVTLPCNFTYPREIEPLQDLRVYWRLGFHGQFIYNHTEKFTSPDYGGRIVLVGDPRGNRTASICINRLQESDAREYVCHIRVRKHDGQWEQWRCHPGTQLTVKGAPPCPGFPHLTCSYPQLHTLLCPGKSPIHPQP